MNLRKIDSQYVWHPFTPSEAWLDPDFSPLFIEKAKGCTLTDQNGGDFLDGNSSIWTNIHGHAHPHITQALKKQLSRVAHVSYLGLAHEPGATFAKALSEKIGGMHRVFYSDDGSTAIETALKIAFQFFYQNGEKKRTRFISLGGAYHGDTVGAMSAGHSGTFHEPFRKLLFSSSKAMTPYCYRCVHNQAKPEKADGRTYRKCKWECVGDFEKKIKSHQGKITAAILEPKVQGPAGMIMHPHGYLKRIAPIVKKSGGFLILDEVMTGFGRTGEMFAFEHEIKAPDLIALGKGIGGGYTPLGATLVKENIFKGFQGGLEKTFFHGHSFSGHLLGCVAGRASLEVFKKEKTLAQVKVRSKQLSKLRQVFWEHPCVGDVRQEGLILGVELVQDFSSRKPFALEKRIAYQISERARNYGLITRGIGNVLVLMPPLCVSSSELKKMVEALYQALCDVLPFSKKNVLKNNRH